MPSRRLNVGDLAIPTTLGINVWRNWWCNIIHVPSLLVMNGGGLALFYCPWWGRCFMVMKWLMIVLLSQNHKHSDSPCVYKAGWCARQVMCFPCWWELTSSKQPMSRDLWFVWPHHDSIFQCTWRLYNYQCRVCTLSALCKVHVDLHVHITCTVVCVVSSWSHHTNTSVFL